MSTITPDQLSRYNGLNGMPVYLSVKGQVYDVTSGAAFYGPGERGEGTCGGEG